MCKAHNPRRIDKCMFNLIEKLKNHLYEDDVSVVACCCGHGKYPMSIIVREEVYINGIHSSFIIKDWMSGKEIPRKRKFYKKDSEGYYYIPEVKSQFLQD